MTLVDIPGALICHIGRIPTEKINKQIFGTYESVPAAKTELARLEDVFDFPEPDPSLSRTLKFTIGQDGDQIFTKLVYGDPIADQTLKFKLGVSQRTNIAGRDVDFVYVFKRNDPKWVANKVQRSATLRGVFRDVASGIKFVTEAVFSENNINATYTKEERKTNQSFRKIFVSSVIPKRNITLPKIEGHYKVLSANQSADIQEFAKTFLHELGETPKPPFGLDIFQDPEKEQHIQLVLTGRNIVMKPQLIAYPNEEVESKNESALTYEFEQALSSNTSDVAMSVEISKDGIKATLSAENETVSFDLQRAVQPEGYGLFQYDPSSSENPENLTCSIGFESQNDGVISIQVYRRVGDPVDLKDMTYFRVTHRSGIYVDYPFVLDESFEKTLRNGSSYKHTITEGDWSARLSLNLQLDQTIQTIHLDFDPEGITSECAAVSSSSVSWTSHRFRRTLSPLVFGKFERVNANVDVAQPDTKPNDFHQFLSIRAIEFKRLRNNEYSELQTKDNQNTVALPSVFSLRLFRPDESGTEPFYTYLDDEITPPVLRVMPDIKRPEVARWIEFHPTGLTARMFNMADRTSVSQDFRRIGASVERDEIPTVVLPYA